MKSKIVLNGQLLDQAMIALSPTDPGFCYGYGVFETIKFKEGAACYFDEHVARLKAAVEAAGLDMSIDRETLKREATALFRANDCAEGIFKIIVWEGAAGAEIVLFVRDFNYRSDAGPVRLKLSPAVVGSRAFTSRHKTLNYMEVVRDLRQAKASGFDECVYRNEFGFVTETSVSNLFFVNDGVLKTPRLDCGLLDGIVRARLIELASQLGMVVEEGAYMFDELVEADEVFVTNSGVGVGVVQEIDNGEGQATKFENRTFGERLRVAYLEQEQADLQRW